MSPRAITMHRAWLYISQALMFFSLLVFTAVCSISGVIGAIVVLGDFYPHDPSCTFTTALTVLYLVPVTQNVFLYSTRLSPLANVAASSCSKLLSEVSTPCLWLSDGSPKDTAGDFLGKPGNLGFPMRPVCFASDEGCMGFMAAVSRTLWVSCFFPSSPWVHRYFEMLMSLKVWLLLCMKTQYLWQLTSNQ